MQPTRPTQGIDLILTKSKNIIEIKTKTIEIFLFVFKTSLKKIFPNKTLKIGMIKYPKLASIIWLFATA